MGWCCRWWTLCGLAIARRRLHSLPGAKGNSQTALFYASRQGRCEIIQYLMSQGADPNVVDEFGETALLGCAAYSCLFWGDGGQESAEWAGSKQFVWLWVLSLRDRIFVWPLFVQVCPGSNSESRKKRVPYNMTDGQHFVSPRVQTILSHSKTVETHYDMPVVPLWGCFMPSGVRRQLRPRPCWKAVRIWKRLGVGMGSACHMQGTPRLQKIEMW